MLRKRETQTNTATEEVELLDDKEQEELILKLARDNARSNRILTIALIIMSFCLGLFFSYAAISQFTQPWFLLKGWFADTLPSYAVILTLEITSLALLCDSLYMFMCLSQPQRAATLRITSIALSLVPLLFWIVAFVQAGAVPYHLLWLSGTAPVVTGVCWYTEYAANSVAGGISELRKLKYDYLKA